MTGLLDRFGEPLDPIEDDETLARTRDEIHRDRCAELRRILKDARQRREAQP